MKFLVVLFLCAYGAFGGVVDPELKMNTVQIINHWGYPAEEHHILTDDNYILSIHRIPYGKDGPSSKRPVIFLQHGLEDCSVSWVINLPNQSAGFIFADAGFDVWMGNMRGNTYSRDHLTYSPKSHEFWRFTFDDMAEYDLSAQINYVLKNTNQSSLYYVGHSQGTLTMFAKLAEDQTFAKKIKSFFALAPVGRVQNIQGLFDVVAHYLYTEIKLFYYLLGDGEFFPTGTLFTAISELVCKNFIGAEFCDSFVMLIFGVDSNQLNVTRTPVYMSHIPGGSSTMNVLHWTQMVRSGLVSKYDYGTRHENIEKYGQATPPLYDFTKVNTDMYLYWSPKDWVADETDITEYLLNVLPQEYIKENTKLEDFNHVDFLWGRNAADQIYKPIIQTIKKGLE